MFFSKIVFFSKFQAEKKAKSDNSDSESDSDEEPAAKKVVVAAKSPAVKSVPAKKKESSDSSDSDSSDDEKTKPAVKVVAAPQKKVIDLFVNSFLFEKISSCEISLHIFYAKKPADSSEKGKFK